MQTLAPSLTTGTALARLRQDIGIQDGGTDSSGRPITVVVDTIRNAYYRLYWPESQIVKCWRETATLETLIARLRTEHGLDFGATEAAEIQDFLFQNQLTETGKSGGWRDYHTLASAHKKSWLSFLVHNYLFFRIPLVHPEPFLKRMLPRLAFLYSRTFLYVCLMVLCTGGYLITRQWSDFSSMFLEAQKLPSLTTFAIVLLVLKAIHELGHALTAERFGSRVPSMGIAFMLGTPVFYTDTTDSWRLSKRSERLAIVFGGVAAEMIVACLAVITWPFLPDGLGREICFAVMTSSVATTLAVNLNPCMRYDGYFALSDYLDVANLQPRSFALGTWKLRDILFGLNQPPPEDVEPKLRTILIAYAWTTWVYRLLLFTGIAVLVYTMVLKVLGIALGLFEIVVFVATPVVRELRDWWSMRALLTRHRRPKLSFAVAAVALIMFFLPLDRHVEAPAVLAAQYEEPIHLSAPALITAVHAAEGQSVAKGDILFEAISPEILSKLARARLQLKSVEFQLARLPGFEKDQEWRLVLSQQRDSVREKIAALERQRAALIPRASVSGTIVDLDAGVKAGVWQSPSRPLARIAVFDSARARGIVSDSSLNRLSAGAEAVFVPEDASQPSRKLRLETIAAISKNELSEPMLAEINGGPVPVSEIGGEPVTVHGGFEVQLVSGDGAPTAAQRGTVRIDAKGQSPFTAVWQQIARVLVRESGF